MNGVTSVAVVVQWMGRKQNTKNKTSTKENNKNQQETRNNIQCAFGVCDNVQKINKSKENKIIETEGEKYSIEQANCLHTTVHMNQTPKTRKQHIQRQQSEREKKRWTNIKYKVHKINGEKIGAK